MSGIDYRRALNNSTYISRQLKYLESTPWKIDEYNKLKKEYFNRINAINSPVIGLGKGAILYRATFIDKQGMLALADINESDLFNSVGRLGINSKERTTAFGRAHHPHSPVLYTALRPETAIHEMVQWDREQYKLNDVIARFKSQLPVKDHEVEIFHSSSEELKMKHLIVSAWEIQKPMLFTYFLDSNLIPAEIKGAIEHAESINAHFRNGRKEITKSLDLIKAFFVKHFTKTHISSNADYMLSALAADLALLYSKSMEREGRGKKSDGILYASVAEGHEGVNCVISAEAVAENKIKFVGAKCHSVLRPEKTPLDERFPAEKFHGILAEATLVSEETGELVWKIFKREGDKL